MELSDLPFPLSFPSSFFSIGPLKGSGFIYWAFICKICPELFPLECKLVSPINSLM